MRVISGSARGRSLKAVPGNGTRPTTDKVKEALFSMIGPYFDGERVLDLFAGSGGLGIEALSRGAAKAVFVDMERKSIEVVRDNVKTAGVAERAEIYCNDAVRAVKALAKREAQFELIFLDPPYRIKTMDVLLESMQDAKLIAPGGIVVIEHEEEHHYPAIIGALHEIRRAAYGDTALTIYRHETQQEGEMGEDDGRE